MGREERKKNKGREDRKKDRVKEYDIDEYEATVRFYESPHFPAMVYLKIGPVVISGMSIRENRDGYLFVSWPARKLADGTYKNTAYTVDTDLNDMILEAYDVWIDER